MRDINIIAHVKHASSLRQLWPWMKGKVIRMRKDDIDLLPDYLHSKFDGYGLRSLWNNQTFSFISVWSWMKVKVNIMTMWCMLMPEAVTVPSLMMMTLIVSEESLAMDTVFCLVYLKLFQNRKWLWKQKCGIFLILYCWGLQWQLVWIRKVGGRGRGFKHMDHAYNAALACVWREIIDVLPDLTKTVMFLETV